MGSEENTTSLDRVENSSGEVGGDLVHYTYQQMADLGLTEQTYWDWFEDNLCHIVKYIAPEVFLTKLRSSRVLSESDCEEISSPYLFPTRRDRARKFCDVLLTKGFDAFKLFLELLEYEYPHVFQNITNHIPRNPPQGYERHTEGRISQNLDDFVRMGFKVANLRNQENTLFAQLEDLQKMLEFTQIEKNDLEKEILSLRPYAMKNRQLQEKLNEAEKEIRNLKDENREFMKKNIQYRDEIDREQSRIEQLLIDRDDLETKLKEATNELERMNQSQDFLREKFEEERKKSQRLITIATRRTAKYPPDGKSGDLVEKQHARNIANISTKMEILQCDLDAEREKVKDLCATLDVTQEDLASQRQTVETLRRDKLKLQRENDQTQLFLKHAERKNEQYFKTIQELEKEKRKAEEEKILAQQKCWDISDQKQQLFVAKHNLEQKYDRLRQNYERIRENNRNSLTDPLDVLDGGETAEGLRSPTIRHRVTPLPSPRSPVSPHIPAGEDPIYTTIPSDPFSQFQPYPCDTAIRFRYGRQPSSSGSSDAQQDSGVYTLRLDLIQENSPYANWFEGHDITVTESYSVDQKDGDDVVQKMNMKNLYVRSNITWEDKQKEDTVPIQEGEFLFISDTAKLNYFLVSKVEPTSGHHMKKSATGLVPDFELAKQYIRRPSASILSPDPNGLSRGTPFIRRDAIRSKDCSPYTVIAPLKASQKLPVLLNGNPTVVEAILDVLATDAEEWAMIVKKPVLIHQRQNWREMCDLLRHTVMPGFGINHQSDRDQHRYIVINIKLTADDCQEQLKVIFGHDFDDVQCDKGVSLSKWALHSETLGLPSPKITGRSSLMSQLREKIVKVQENIFWMTISWKTINSLKASC